MHVIVSTVLVCNLPYEIIVLATCILKKVITLLYALNLVYQRLQNFLDPRMVLTHIQCKYDN